VEHRHLLPLTDGTRPSLLGSLALGERLAGGACAAPRVELRPFSPRAISVKRHAMSDKTADAQTEIMEPTLWQKNGWTAKVIKNEDDDGWAVEIHKAGIAEPVLVSPWVMGRDKKNPKPFDGPAFATFVKTASEVLDRSARQREAALKKTLSIAWGGKWFQVCLELVPDEYEPYSVLSATDDRGEVVARHRVAEKFKFTRDSANAWVQGGFQEP
jgi:hypothetical protein